MFLLFTSWLRLYITVTSFGVNPGTIEGYATASATSIVINLIMRRAADQASGATAATYLLIRRMQVLDSLNLEFLGN
jgi:hypothetical protein